MKFSLNQLSDVLMHQADMRAYFVWQDEDTPDTDTKSVPVMGDELRLVDTTLDGMIKRILDTEGFDGSLGKATVLTPHGKLAAHRLLLIGLGKRSKLTVEKLMTVAAHVGRKANEFRSQTLQVVLPSETVHEWSPDVITRAFIEGIRLGVYEFSKHKSTPSDTKPIREVTLGYAYQNDIPKTAIIDHANFVSNAVYFARDLVNEPPSVTTPTHLSIVAQSLAKEYPDALSVEVYDRKQIEKLGMHALLGIARGSDEEPRFIHLTYKRSGNKQIVLVGKGITFDTGGLSLKPSEHMETMKMDMAGAAAILGIFSVLPDLQPGVTVHGLISATENMPSGKAIKPGDIVKAMNGKTIEILNTDAEGRVVLADALSYAGARLKPDAIIDLATLTGACMVALGQDMAGVFSNTQDLANQLLNCAKDAGEQLWELPLVDGYDELLKSDVADVKNISGGRYGGAITAALFLRKFVSAGVPWAHMDIAGPAFAEKDTPLTPKGGTGYGVRTVLEYLLRR